MHTDIFKSDSRMVNSFPGKLAIITSDKRKVGKNVVSTYTVGHNLLWLI